MTKHNEVFSIIMPSFNAENTISTSVLSVINQTYSSWRLYVVDDCSTDNTRGIISKYLKVDSRIEYIRLKKNSGVSVARNAGINLARGKYIAFLDSDDIWVEGKLQQQLTILESGYDVVCSNYATFKESVGCILSERTFPIEFTYADMLTGNKIGNLTGVYNQERIGKVFQNGFGHEDYVMWLAILKRTSKCFCIQDNLAYYRVSGSSLSANKIRASLWQWKIYRSHLGLSVVRSIYYWYCYVLNAFVR